MARSRSGDADCPCGSGGALAACCGRLHRGETAPDAEALMRSRYAAYALGLDDYLLATWHRSTRPASLADADRARTRWLGLEVRRVVPAETGPDGVQRARVEFVARFRVDGRGHRIHEDSAFVREDGRWYYVDGEMR